MVKDLNHMQYEEALMAKSFNSLSIKRNGDNCFLLIDIDGTPHVYVNKKGLPVYFNNIWEIKDWLSSKYMIVSDEIETIIS